MLRALSRFVCQHPHGSSQSPVSPLSRDLGLTPSPVLRGHWTLHIVYTDARRQSTHKHKIKTLQIQHLCSIVYSFTNRPRGRQTHRREPLALDKLVLGQNDK